MRGFRHTISRLQSTRKWHGPITTGGLTSHNLGKEEAALADYQKATVLDNEYEPAWKNIGSALYNLKQYEKALIACDTAITIRPTDAAAWKTKSEVLIALDKKDEAAKAASKAEELLKE